MLKHKHILSTVFGRPFLRRLLSSGTAELSEVLSLTGFQPTSKMSVGDAYQKIYLALLQQYRCEYIYKNALAAKIVMGRHSPRTTSLLSEVGVEQSKADLVLINGTAVVYEIKTELDSARRLASQLSSYSKTFADVYVVCPQNQVSLFEGEVPSKVGILALTRRYTLHLVRAAESSRDRLDKAAMFDLLHRDEYIAIIRENFDDVPSVPNTKIYSECRSLFLNLPLDVAYSSFVQSLRSRGASRLPENDLKRIPHCLLFHGLSGTLSTEEIDALDWPLGSV